MRYFVFLLALSLSAAAGAADYETTVYFPSDAETIADLKSQVHFLESENRTLRQKINTLRVEKGSVRADVCPGGWEDSRYLVFEIDPGAKKWDGDKHWLEVCKESGLLRVNP